MLLLRHAVGGSASALGDHITVHAIGDLEPVRALENRLGAGLLLLGILMIPFATWLGRGIARRALAPITELVDEIRALSSERMESTRPLSAPTGAVTEVAVLTEAFNHALGRLDVHLRTMRRFTEDASHEIRNPLSVLRTGLEVALRHERTEAEYRALLVENLEEIQRLQSILDGLLLMARAEPDRLDLLQREPVDLVRAAREAAHRFSVVAHERSSAIEIHAPEPVEIDGDPRLVRLIFFNLLDNALKHGAEGEPIVVEVTADATGARIAVSNAGSPIPEETRRTLFERYDRPSSGDRGGVGGLGLSVVRWAAEAHGGEARYGAAAGGNRFEVELRGTAAARQA
jgi:signal transduction histidine kinase